MFPKKKKETDKILIEQMFSTQLFIFSLSDQASWDTDSYRSNVIATEGNQGLWKCERSSAAKDVSALKGIFI